MDGRARPRPTDRPPDARDADDLADQQTRLIGSRVDIPRPAWLAPGRSEGVRGRSRTNRQNWPVQLLPTTVFRTPAAATKSALSVAWTVTMLLILAMWTLRIPPGWIPHWRESNVNAPWALARAPQLNAIRPAGLFIVKLTNALGVN